MELMNKEEISKFQFDYNVVTSSRLRPNHFYKEIIYLFWDWLKFINMSTSTKKFEIELLLLEKDIVPLGTEPVQELAITLYIQDGTINIPKTFKNIIIQQITGNSKVNIKTIDSIFTRSSAYRHLINLSQTDGLYITQDHNFYKHIENWYLTFLYNQAQTSNIYYQDKSINGVYDTIIKHIAQQGLEDNIKSDIEELNKLHNVILNIWSSHILYEGISEDEKRRIKQIIIDYLDECTIIVNKIDNMVTNI